MDLSPLYYERRKKLSLLSNHLSSRNSVLEINGYFGTNLFWVEGLGFENLIGIGKEFEDLFAFYVGYQEEEAMINGGKLDKKPLNRIFKSKYTFITGDILTYDFKGRTFDLVFCSFLFANIPYGSHEPLLNAVNKILVPGSIVDISFHSIDFLKYAEQIGYIAVGSNVLKNKYGSRSIYLLIKQEMYQLISQIGCDVLDEQMNKGIYHFILKKK